MAECSVCGDNSSLSYTCRRCEKEFCSKHQLPENHNCVGLRLIGMDRWFSEKFEKSSDGIADLGDTKRSMGSTGTVKKPDLRSKSDQKKIRESAKRKRERRSDHFGAVESGDNNQRNKSKSEIPNPRKPNFTEHSPDVNPDGSIARPNAHGDPKVEEENQSLITRFRQSLSSPVQRGEKLSDAQLERQRWQRKRKLAHQKARVRAFIYSLPHVVLKATIGAVVLLLALDYLL